MTFSGRIPRSKKSWSIACTFTNCEQLQSSAVARVDRLLNVWLSKWSQTEQSPVQKSTLHLTKNYNCCLYAKFFCHLSLLNLFSIPRWQCNVNAIHLAEPLYRTLPNYVMSRDIPFKLKTSFVYPLNNIVQGI